MTTEKNNGIFSTLYGTRICVRKGSAPIVNLSLLFGLIALLTAPWLVIGGAIAAVALGYKFSIARRAEGICSSFDDVVREAKDNVRNAVDAVTDHNQPQA